MEYIDKLINEEESTQENVHRIVSSEKKVSPLEEHLLKLKKEAEEISGNWNGDESGYQEDQAHIAEEIIEKVDELLKLINEFNGTN